MLEKALASRYLSARSSSSLFRFCMPRRFASGAYISIVSEAMRS
jgi:hypothetical protein